MSDAELVTEQARALREITAAVAALKGDAARVFYELGTLLRRVEDEALWRAGGYASFTAYLESEVDLARSTARRCIEVSRHFNLDISERYGFDKLWRGLRYLELTRRQEKPGDLIAADLRLRGDDGRFFHVPFHEATGRQIDEAARLERARSRRTSARELDPPTRDRLNRLNASLPPPPAGVRVRKDCVEVSNSRRVVLGVLRDSVPGGDAVHGVPRQHLPLGATAQRQRRERRRSRHAIMPKVRGLSERGREDCGDEHGSS